MKHLVLGSEGLIGKAVCNELSSKDESFIRWDVKLGPKYDLLNSDNIGFLEDSIQECDFVHFLAFDVGGAKYLASKKNDFSYVDDNVTIMQTVFRLLKKYGKPFYFASSQMSNMTDSAYGQLKSVGEHYTNSLYGINVRFWNVYGYESDPEKSHVITDFINMVLDEDRIICRTDGNEKRSFMHDSDAAVILTYIASLYANYLGKTLDIDTPSYPSTIRDLAEAVYWTIRGKVDDTKLFFSSAADKTQSKENESNMNWYRHTGYTNAGHKFKTLNEGIEIVYKQILKAREGKN